MNIALVHVETIYNTYFWLIEKYYISPSQAQHRPKYAGRHTHHQWHRGVPDPDNSGTPHGSDHLWLFRLCSLRSPWTIPPPTSSPLRYMCVFPLPLVALCHSTPTSNHLRWINRLPLFLIRHIYTKKIKKLTSFNLYVNNQTH